MGAATLRRKREALVAELFRLARPSLDARAVISERARAAYGAVLEALVAHGDAALTALAHPARLLTVEMTGRLVWGIPVSDITARPPVRRTVAARATAPGLTGPAAAHAASSFEDLIERLLDAAPREMLIERLGAALSQTSRRVNTLEKHVEPAIERHLRLVREALDEREREEHVRHKHLRRVTGGRAGRLP